MKFDTKADYLFHIYTNEDENSIRKLAIASNLLQLLGYGTGFEMVHQLPDKSWGVARHWLYISINCPEKAAQLIEEINSALAGIDFQYCIEMLRKRNG